MDEKNDTAAHILAGCRRDRLQHLVAAHLSEQNNRPDLACEALSRACGAQPQDIVVADPASGFDWLSIR